MAGTAAMSGAALPGYWRFAWMFFMQPVSLHRRLKACGIDDPDIPGWAYWHQRHELNPIHAGYLARLGFLLLWPVVGLAMAWLANSALGLGLPISRLAVGVVVGVALGLALGVALGVAFGVALGVAFSVALGVAFSVVLGLTLGVALGLLFGVWGGVGFGLAGGVVGGVAFGALLGMLLGMLVGVLIGMEVGVAVGVAVVLGYLRLPIYLLECLLQWSLYLARGQLPAHTLRYSPALFHELSYLPHPFLGRHIVEAADIDPDLVARVLEACRIAPGQRRVGERALAEWQARTLAERQARELADLARQRHFQAAVELQGRWLPGKDTDNALLRALAETARLFAAAQGSSSFYLARQHLDAAEKQLATIDNQRLASREVLARFLPDTLVAWRAVLAEMRASSQEAAAEQLPNPFITGNPLSGEQLSGKDVFRGREASIRQVENLLGGDQASLALIGPRRCGKSSLINMFKLWLPDTQVVMFDLQDNPAGTPAGFYRALAEQTRRQAYQDRRLNLPAFPEGASIEALRAWLDELEAFPGVARFLICIDEFERLPKLFPGQEQELLQFMGLLRATIQHRRRVRLLVAGAAPFDELDHLWSDHFINLREVRIGYLDAPTCVGLLTRPVEEFPADAVPEEVARALVARTGGQPFLVQLYGSLLVDRLNEAKRKTATLDDVEPVEQEVLDQASNYFRNLWGDLPPAAHPVLRALDAGQSARADAATQHWLRRRLIVSEDGALLVPVFGRWVRENVLA